MIAKTTLSLQTRNPTQKRRVPSAKGGFAPILLKKSDTGSRWSIPGKWRKIVPNDIRD